MAETSGLVGLGLRSGKVLRAVAAKHNLPVAAILGRDRFYHFQAARREAVLEMHSLGMTHGVIANAIGRHRTTIIDYTNPRPENTAAPECARLASAQARTRIGGGAGMTPATEKQLRDRISELEELVLQQKAAFIPAVSLPHAWGLQPQERLMVLALYHSSGLLTHEQLSHVIAYKERYSDWDNIVKARICTLRKKLWPFGIEIWTRWGSGYELSTASKQIIKLAIEQRAAA